MSTSYRSLIVWQRAMEVVEEIYRITKDIPSHETYGLTQQMHRSAVSIPSNIAEGRYRDTSKDYQRFLRIAFASGAELETQIEIAIRIGYLQGKQCVNIHSKLAEVMRMLNALLIGSKKKL